MRSLAEALRGAPPRVTVERALRVAALALLAWLLWRSLVPPSAAATVTVRTAALAAALPRWSWAPPAPALHVGLEAAPDGATRDWLRALARAGTAVSWEIGDPVAAAAMVERISEPRGGVRVRVAAPGGATVTLADAGGPLDSVRATGAGIVVEGTSLAGAVVARVGDQRVTAAASDSLLLRRVLLLGRAGWEAKFVAAALEERGWMVDARLIVAPGLAVEQGRPAPIDTARYAAVVVLDGSAGRDAARIAAYVRSGGGVVLGPDAARAGPLGTLAPGEPGALRAAVAATTAGRDGLAVRPLVRLRQDAVVMERRGAQAVGAARRVGAGRVAYVGYEESWRWRLAGEEAAHRRWWSRVVSSVAYAPSVAATAAVPAGDDAPLARLVEALGPARRAPNTADAGASATPPWWAILLFFALLLAEWGSRRFRGVP